MRIYKANEVSNERFYQIPKSLFGNPRYKGLSPAAKLVYAFLRDRMELSKANGWITESGDIYLLFTRENIAELLEMSLPSVIKCFKQLIQSELILEKRQGLGKPNLIFIGYVEISEETSLNERIFTSGHKNSLYQDIKNFYPNDTDVSETEKSDTERRYNAFPLTEKELSTGNKELSTDGKELSTDGKVVFETYKEYYKQYTGKEHRRISQDTIDKINKIAERPVVKDYQTGNIIDMDTECILDMIEKYFDTSYDCDRNINHFLDEKIQRNLFFNSCY